MSRLSYSEVATITGGDEVGCLLYIVGAGSAAIVAGGAFGFFGVGLVVGFLSHVKNPCSGSNS